MADYAVKLASNALNVGCCASKSLTKEQLHAVVDMLCNACMHTRAGNTCRLDWLMINWQIWFSADATTGDLIPCLCLLLAVPQVPP